MIEARITCIVGKVRVPDLGLNLVQGMTVYMAEMRARGSKDLQRAWRANGVEVVYVQRSRKSREAPPPQQNNPVFPKPQGMAAFVPERAEDETVVFDADAVAERVLEGMDLKNAVNDVVGARMREMEDRLLNQIEARFIKALSNLEVALPVTIPAGTDVAPASVGNVPEDVPVFVPSRIGEEGVASEIRVKVEQRDEDPSAAAAALRAAKKAVQE